MILEQSNTSMIDVELQIMNSHPEHNLISEGKEQLSKEDMLKDHIKEEGVVKERYLIKSGSEYIGILDFTMENPKDKKPWLGLFIIKKELEGRGAARRGYNLYENLMVERNISEVRLGCYKDNSKGLKFWEKCGFSIIKKIDYNDRTMFILEKNLEIKYNVII